MVKNKAMENSFDTPCTAPQVEDEHKLYENLRNWDDEIINQKMEDLGIPNVKLTPKRKYILGMIDSLADIDTKKFFLRNSDFMEIANISKAPFMEAIKYFSKLGIIKRVRGVRGTASEYKFNEKNLKKLPLENQTLNTKKNQTLNGVSPSVLSDSSEYGLGKGSGQKQSVENQPPHTHTQSHIQSQLQKQSHLQLQEQLHLQLYSQEQMEWLSKILSDNNTRLIESINTIVQAIVNTKDETIEELKKISTSIDNTSKSNGIVQPSIDSNLIEEKDKIIEELQGEINKLKTEANTKDEIIEELQVKLQSSSMDNNGKIQPSIDTKDETNDKVDNTPIESSTVQSEYNSKVIEESDNSKDVKESSSNSNGEVQDPSSSNIDKILSHQLDVVSKDPIKDKAWEREQQKKVDTKTASKTTVQESNSKEDERNYVLQKLDNLKKSWIEKINTATTEEKLFEYSDESLQQFSDFAKTHVEIQKESKEVFKELQPLFEAKYNQFQTDKETTPKAETCEEKKETTAEPSTANSKSIEVSNVDTSDNKEEQKKLDDELDETASTKKSEEVEISKDEEERQLQELKETFKPLLENFKEDMTSEERERILNEIRKAYTTKGYSQKVLQPFLDFALTYNFYAEKRDVVEVPQQETPSEVSNQTVEEPKQEETVTPSEEPRDEDYWNPTFTDEQAQEALSKLPNANSRYGKDEAQEEVIEGSEDEVSDDDMKGVVVGGSYPEENDPEF